jgi:hypothetical protein
VALRLSVLDVVGLVTSGLALLGALVAVLAIQPAFAEMFSDFGGELPWLTRVALQPWPPLVVALVPLLLVAESALRSVGRTGRMIRVAVSLVVVGIGSALFLMALYLPIFDLAGAVVR